MEAIREKNEQREIEKLFPRIYRKMDEIRALFKEIEVENPEKIDNIAIFLNNKIVEIGQEYRAKNIGFYSEAKLKPIIVLKLLSYYEHAYKTLNNFSDMLFKECMNEQEARQFLEDGLWYLEVYDLSCKKIYDYNIKDNIVSNIIEEFMDYPDKRGYLVKVEEYKEELLSMGYEEQVKELNRELKKFAKNIVSEINNEQR